MGVHYFFPWIKKECPLCLRSEPNYSPGSVLLFDVNGLLYGAGSEPVDACRAVMKIVEDRVRESRASVVVLAIDGVAPKAKRWQQRKRRFINPDNNRLSVGTSFMQSLDREFQDYLAKRSVCSTVYFSGSRVAGEGEHKLFRFLNRFRWPGDKYIFGVDGDLLMLALLNGARRVHVVRPVFMRPGLVDCVDIDAFREYVETRFRNAASFVCAANVLGNDFLPSVEPHDTRDSFEEFLQTVSELCLVDADNKVDWNHFSKEPSERGREFARGMQWILDYYTQKAESEWVDWVYPFAERPQWCEIGWPVDEPMTFVGTDALERMPLFQLFFLLPASSASLLPAPLQIVYVESFSVEQKRRKKRPSWDVDYDVVVDLSVNLLNLYKLVHPFLPDDQSTGTVYRFETRYKTGGGSKHALNPSGSEKQTGPEVG